MYCIFFTIYRFQFYSIDHVTLRATPILYFKMAEVEDGDSSYEEEEGSSSGGEEEDYEEEEEEEEEPLLKYGRFAKEVVNSLSQLPSTSEGEPKNVIVCMAVHPKVK